MLASWQKELEVTWGQPPFNDSLVVSFDGNILLRILDTGSMNVSCRLLEVMVSHSTSASNSWFPDLCALRTGDPVPYNGH